MAKKPLRSKTTLTTTLKSKTRKPKADASEMGSLEKFRRMATVIQDSNDAITFQDLDGNILAWNRGAEQIYGYSEAEALRMNIVDTVPTDYQEEAREFLASLKRGELVSTLETKRKTKDGRIVDVWLTNTKLTDDKGKLTGIATTERDITEQTKTLEKFRRMATVIQDSNDAITFQDLDGNILAWNRGAEQIYGYSEAEALTKNIVDTVPTEYQKEALGFLASLKRGELVPTLETKRKTKDGRIVDVWLTNTKLTDDKGNLTGIATTERDISERKQSEASLREKFRELDYLREGQIALSERMRGEQIISRLGQSILSHLVPFTNAQVGAFYLVNDDKKLQMVSGYALAKHEGPERFIDFGEGLIGQVAVEKQPLLIEDVPSSYFNKIGSSFGEMVPRSLLICPILYENEVIGVIELGSLHTFTEHQRVFLSHVSENIGIAINTSDVRKKVQKQNEALNKAQVLLEEKATEVQRASQYKTEFLANMSHELRTPLNSSLILAKLLMDNSKENLTEEQTQYAASIYSSSKDLLNLINDILDLSKVEAGKLDIRVEKVVFRDVIESLKRMFQTVARERNLIFEIDQEKGMAAFFQTDRQRLDQILKNLVSNALKFTDAGSVKVRVYTSPKGQIAFEVSDSGIGIPKEQQAIIFEAFRQADGTTNRKYGGTGLGLSISRDLAKLLKGSIEVESAVGSGSRFTLFLPVMLDETQQIVSHVEVETPSSSAVTYRTVETRPVLLFEDDRDRIGESDTTFLIVEDDVNFAKIIFGVGHERDFKCVIALSADEGVELAERHKPDAVFLDIKLPDHLGLTVLDRLKKNPMLRHVPVITMSSDDFRATSLRMGAMDYLQKPVSREVIGSAFTALQKKFEQGSDRLLVLGKVAGGASFISTLFTSPDVEILTAENATEAIPLMKAKKIDCLIVPVIGEDMSGIEAIEALSSAEIAAFPPTVFFQEKPPTKNQKSALRLLSRSIFLKEARSPENLFDEVALILHRIESEMSLPQKQMVKSVRNRDQVFEGRKILLVDDDIRNIFAMTSALEEKGATIFVGRNGHEALANLEQHPEMDLVLMDIMMPEMDGYEATRRIRKQKRFEHLPIIAVTARAMADDQEKCLEAGTNDYLSKPVDLEKLQSLIRVWITQ